MTGSSPLPGGNNSPGATPRDGCDAGTPIAPQNRRIGGVAPGTTGGAIGSARFFPKARSIAQTRAVTVRQPGRQDVIRAVTEGR